MKNKTILDHISSFVLKIGLVVIALLIVNALEFDIQISKKRNSFVESVADTAESGYSVYKTVKNFIK